MSDPDEAAGGRDVDNGLGRGGGGGGPAGFGGAAAGWTSASGSAAGWTSAAGSAAGWTSAAGSAAGWTSASGTKSTYDPVAPYQCDKNIHTPDNGPIPQEDPTTYRLGGELFRVNSSTTERATCPDPNGELLVYGGWLIVGGDYRGLYVEDCDLPGQCARAPAWQSGAMTRKSGNALSGTYLTTTRADPVSGVCTKIKVLRYLAATSTGALLEEHLRLSPCTASEEGGDADEADTTSCECLSQSYELFMLL